MKKTIAAILAVSLASSAGALTVKVGYGSIGGVNDYQMRDRAPAPDQYTNESEDISLGLFAVGAEEMMKINDMFSIGFEVGAGAPLGEYKFEDTKMTTGWTVGQIDPDTGDYTTFKAATATILVKGVASFKAGSGVASVGLGVGTVLVGLMIDDVDQGWKDITTGTGSWNKNDATDLQGGKHTLSSSIVVPVFCIQVTPGYRMALTDTDIVGVELPISVNSVTKEAYDEVDNDPVDPDMENPAVAGPQCTV